MKVLIAAVSAPSEISGVQRHAFNLASCLLRLAEISRVELVVAPWQAHLTSTHAPLDAERIRVHVAALRNTALARNIWFYDALPSMARNLDVDLVHASYPVPLRRNAFHCPVVVTLHDLYPYDTPRNFGIIKAWLNRRVLQQCLRNADRVTCVSDATVASLKRHVTPQIWRKASRIYNTVEPATVKPLWPSTLLPRSAPFLLCVAQHRHNKNISLALRAFHFLLQRRTIHSATRLLVIGIGGPETQKIKRLIDELGLRGLVILAEGLPEESLQWCYKHCAALVMPSLTEGFGLPAVEALMVGCNVVCSDIPALREVGGEHCRFVSLAGDRVEAFADAIAAARGFANPAAVSLPQFSAAQIASEYFTLYREVLANAKTTPAPQAIAHLSSSARSERSPV